MTFGPLTGEARARKIRVYDLEWYPADPKKAAFYGVEPLGLRLIGYFDGERYRSFYTVPDFLNSVCNKENSGAWIFAHAGGLADLVFILQYMVDNPRPGIQISCHFSGSSAIIVRVDRGKDHWFFVDSYWLIRQPLREIAKWLGMEKGGTKESIDHFYAPLAQLKIYNENDCRILYAAIVMFEQKILELGGELQKTIASTALCLFRRRFLKNKIVTDEKINGWAREAYSASRVEPFESECEDALYYDVNSSFPYAMTFPAPGNVKRFGRRLKDGELGLARARVSVPDMWLPPLPYRSQKDKRVYFPVGEWNAWFNDTDLMWLEEQGGKIIKVYEAVAFEEIDDLKGYAQTIYEWRKSSTDPALKIVLKFLLNSLYGKFGEGRLKQRVLINPGPEIFKIPERAPGGLGRELLMPGVHAIVEDREIKHAHVPIAAHITAIARRVLGEYLVKAPRLYYCDTDGFACQGVEYPESDELGGLKLEKRIHRGVFAAPKLYAYQKADGEAWTVRGKGFSRVRDQETGETRPLAYQDFLQLLEHKDLHLEQFARLRGLWREGDTRPKERDLTKTWRGTVRTKRKPEGKGTVPWTVKELRQ